MKRLLPLLATLLLVSPALAVEPVKVTANDMTVDEKNSNAVFAGEVIITRAGLTIWADKVVVLYGSGGESDIDSLTATGKVRIKTPTQDATGGKAVYNPDTMIVRLTENVTVRNAQGEVNGPELTINLKDDSSTFRGGDGGRVTGVFTPQ